MAVSTDTPFGLIKLEEDFMVTAVGDLPELTTLNSNNGTVAIVASQLGGVIRLPTSGSDSDGDNLAIGFERSFMCAEDHMIYEVRLDRSSVSNDHALFLGFTDLAAGDEIPFTKSSSTLSVTGSAEAVGFLWDEDTTNKAWTCVGAVGGSATVDQELGTVGSDIDVVDVWNTFRVDVGPGGKVVEYSINGIVVHRATSTSALVSASTVFAWNVTAQSDGTGSPTIDVDYAYATGSRRSAV